MTVNGVAKRSIVEVKLDELSVDIDVQRALDQGRVERLAKDFEPDALGTLTVSLRPDGTRTIIDGQHRHAAALQSGYDKAVTAVQYEGLTTSEEAVLFLTLNNTKQVHPLDKLRARILAGEPKAVDIKRVLDAHGWKIRISREDWSINAVGSVEKVYDGMGVVKGDDPTLLNNVMTVITAAWNGSSFSVSAPIMGAMGKFLGWYGKEIDYEKMISELGQIKPTNLVADMRVIASMQRVDLANAGARILQGIHNSKRRSNRIPEWVNR